MHRDALDTRSQGPFEIKKRISLRIEQEEYCASSFGP